VLKLYSPLLIPSPIEVGKSLVSFFMDTELLIHLGATLLRILAAFIISTIFGIIIGLAVGYYSIIDKSSELLIDFLRSIPGIVIFPLFILFFGTSEMSRILVAIFVAIPIIIINTKYGVKNSNESRKNMRKIYNLKTIDFFKRVLIPESSPYIFTGIKIALSFSIILIIVTEMLLGTKYGLGRLLILSQYEFNTAMLFSIIILLGSIGMLFNFGFNQFEKKTFHWRE
jgi:NitT/TauT family transport system permease protein